MNLSILFILAAQSLVAHGRLAILQGRPTLHEYSQYKRKIICVTDEEESGALVWNRELNWNWKLYDSYESSTVTKFRLRGESRTAIDCELSTLGGCTGSWNVSGWSLTSSGTDRMGPVLDRRWEDFQEYSISSGVGFYKSVKLPKKITSGFAFSVRATTDAHLLLCDRKQYSTNFCYWIIIGGWANSRSVIRKCVNGLPPVGDYRSKPDCYRIRANYTHSPLSASEWRTFVFTWDKDQRNISIYDTERMILSYVDEEGGLSNQSHYVFIGSSAPYLYRIHQYNFLHTSQPTSALTSPAHSIKDGRLCVEVVLGLCRECEMEIAIVAANDPELKQTIEIVRPIDTVHGLPGWRSVKINKTIETLPDFPGNLVNVTFLPKLRRETDDKMWAVANFRACPPENTVRYGSMVAYQDYGRSIYYWTNTTCQQLSYQKNTVVSILSTVSSSELQTDDQQCLETFVGPRCRIDCREDLGSADCGGCLVCQESGGCDCVSGFVGTGCGERCNYGRYGRDCRETCGACLHENCHFRSGHCTSGCDNRIRYNIPPFCKAGIDEPGPPEIPFLNETTATAVLPVLEDYSRAVTGYSFVLRRADYSNGETDWKPIVQFFPNSTELAGVFDGLKPGISYEVSCLIYVDGNSTRIDGRWGNFTTRCTPRTLFELESAQRGITIQKHADTREEKFPCPEQWYDFVLENVDENREEERGRLPALPHRLSNLTPYTLYKITIGRGEGALFSKEIRTLEAAPSKVRGLETVLTSETNVTIKWTVPEFPNGISVKYNVRLKTVAYLGCKNAGTAPSIQAEDQTEYTTEFRAIAIPNLHRYTRYRASVTACTSYCGDEVSVQFDTPESAIPTAILSDLRLDDNALRWSKPRDCRTISGPIPVARIIVDGVSTVAHYEWQTKEQAYPLRRSGQYLLNGAESYRARVYAIRDYNKRHNEQAYTEAFFTTPPRPPPEVRNFEIYEVSVSSAVISLRWQKPLPPIHGEIDRYQISNCNSKHCQLALENVPTNSHCELWQDYLCADIDMPATRFYEIQISAVNKNVSQPGSPSFVDIVRGETPPEAPENLTLANLANGLINASWSHPWRTGGHLDKFQLTVKLLSSNLRGPVPVSRRGMIYEHPVRVYKRVYHETIGLLPSSRYTVSVQPITVTRKYGGRRSELVATSPAIGFDGNVTAEVDAIDSPVRLSIPTVVNDTRDSMISVLIKGRPASCENYAKLEPEFSALANATTEGDTDSAAWLAASFPTHQLAGKTFLIGDGRPYPNASNCLFKTGESYLIVLVVQTNHRSFGNAGMLAKTISIRIEEMSHSHHELWIVPCLLLLLVALLALYYYRRRKSVSTKGTGTGLKGEMVLSEKKDTVAGTNVLSVNPSKELDRGSSRGSFASSHESLSPKEPRQPDNRVVDSKSIIAQEGKGSSLVKVKEFEDYVKRAITSGLLEQQYQTFPRGQTKPWDYGALQQNKPKNRYGNLIAYDETRVVLNKISDDPYSDYINANYIRGYKKEKCYIATQGPKSNTVVDFWRMIWQEGSLVICMLANVYESGKIKCEQYWPDIGKKKKYGDVIVLNAKHNVFADYTIRTLHVTCGTETRKIEHLHYTAWPDHGVPLYTHSVVTYLKKLLAMPAEKGPVVVHCSAGVGRTGTIILCDICLRRAAAEQMVDVFGETESIRSQRANMVDNKQQYIFAHLILVECLLSFPTALACDESLPSRITEMKQQLAAHRDRLQRVGWQDEALRPPIAQPPLSKVNLAKNRFPELVSPKVSRIFLNRYPVTEEDSDYISAVYVDGVRSQNQYIATQLPLPSTLNDFWRMVAEMRSELLVMLQPPDSSDPTCCPIVPANEFKPTPYLNVLAKDFTELEHYTSEKLTLVDNSEKPAREQSVTILSSTKWEPGRNKDPPAPMTLVSLWQAAERIPRGEGPTIVLCHDGVTGCGIYLALSFLLERMAVERECDVCLAIQALRRSRPDFVQSLEHMEYLYDAAITYLQYFETYANFT